MARMSLAEFGWKLCATGLVFVPALAIGLMGHLFIPAKVFPLLPPMLVLAMLLCLAISAIGLIMALLGHLLQWWRRS